MKINSDTSISSRSQSHLELLSLHPMYKKIDGNTLVFTMECPESAASLAMHEVKLLEKEISKELPSDLDEAIAKLVVEKRSDLLAVVKAEFSSEQPEIHIHDRRSFKRYIREIAASVAGVSDEDSRKIQAIVTQKCLKELWPILCLNEGLNKLNNSRKTLENATYVTPRGKISKQFRHAVKTTALFLDKIKDVENLPKAKIEEKAWETQKLLARNADLQAKLDEMEIPVTEKKLQQEIKQLEIQVQNLVKEMGGDKTEWLGGLLGRLGKSVITQQERDQNDFRFLQCYQGKIDALHNRLQVLTDQAAHLSSRPGAVLKKLESLSKTIDRYHDVTEYLDDYFVLDEAQEAATLRLMDQMAALQEVKYHFSPDAILGMIQQVSKFSKIGAKHKTNITNAKFVEEIDRKTAYQTKQCRQQIEDFMEELVPAIQAEAEEAIAQWNKANKQWQQEETADNQKALLEAEITRQATLEACTLFCDKVEDVLEKFLSSKDVRIIRKLQERLEAQPAPPTAIASEVKELMLGDTLAYLDAIRHERTTISKLQQKREWSQREFVKLDEEGSPSRNLFLRCFFFYLQALTPIAEAFTTPIAKQDYDFCLRMMAKTSQSASPKGESYDDYLAKARGFIGIDHDFLDHYDQFLRGQMQFFYNTMPVEAQASSGMITPGPKTTTETIYEWVEGVAPGSVVDWTASLLGISSQGATEDPSAWDRWVQHAIYPQVKENYFSGVVNYFEQLGSSPPAPIEGDAALFGHHCHQMYESLKSPEGNQAFQTHLEQAKQFSQYKTFLKDYQEYLQAHPPVQVPEMLVPLMEGAVQKAAVEFKLEHVAPLDLPPSEVMEVRPAHLLMDPVTSSASRTNQLFLVTWAQNVASFFGSFLGPTAEQQQFEAKVQTAVVKELPSLKKAIEDLTAIHQELSSVHEQLPTLVQREDLKELKQDIDSLHRRQKDLEKAPSVQTHLLAEVEDWLRDVNAYKTEAARLQNKYESLQIKAQTATLTTLNKIMEGPSLNVSDKDLLHIVGDPFGLGTGLEGSTVDRALNFRLGILKSKLDAIPDLDNLYQSVGLERPENEPSTISNETLIEQMQQALKLHNATMNGTLSDELGEQLRSARVRDPIFFPVGWAGYPSGHSIYFEFMKQEDGRFALRIYNAGAGLDYHKAHAEEFTSKSVNFIEQVDIPLENILHPLIPKAIQELQSVPSGVPWNALDIYGGLLRAIGGSPSIVTYNQDDLRVAAHAGTCAFMSLTTALSYRMDSPDSFHKFEFETELKAIFEYANNNKLRIETGEELAWRLFSKSIEEFSRNVLTYHERGVINDVEQLYANEKVREWQLMVARGEAHHLEQAQAKAPIVDLVSQVFPKLLVAPTYVSSETPTSSTSLPMAAKKPHLLAIQNWVPTVATLSIDLRAFQESTQAAFLDDDYHSVLANIDAISQHLSLSPSGPLYQLSWADSEAIIQSLTAMSKMALQSQLKLTQVEPSTRGELASERLVTYAKLFTICHRLATQAPESIRMPSNAFVSKPLLKHIRGEQLFFRPYSPARDDEIQQMNAYWTNAVEGKWAVWPEMTFGDIHTQRDREFAFDLGHPMPDSLTDNRAHAWLLRLMQTPEAEDKLSSRFPMVVLESQGARAAAAVADIVEVDGKPHPNPRDILPPYFYALRDQMTINHFLTYYRIEQPRGLETHIEFVHYAKKEMDGKAWRIDVTIAGATDYLTSSSTTITHREFTNRHLLNLVIDLNTNIRRESPDKILSTKFASFDKWPVSLQERRHLMGLLSKPALQVRETLAYFMSPHHTHLLTQPDYQVLFSTLFFTPGLLSELKANPEDANHFINMATTFFQTQFKDYSEIDKWHEAAYFAGLSRLFNQYVDYCLEPNSVQLSGISRMNVRTTLTALLQTQVLAADAHASLNLELALTYDNLHKLESLEEAAQLLTAAITYHAKRDHLGSSVSREKELALASLLDRFRENLVELTSGPGGVSLLNQIAMATQVDFVEQSWNPHPTFPRFIAADGSCAIDVLEGILYAITKTEVRLGKNITSHQDFERVFGKNFNPTAKQIGSESYEFTANDDSKCRVITGSWTPIIERLITYNGVEEWYQLVDMKYKFEKHSPLVVNHTSWISKSSRSILIFPDNSPNPRYLVVAPPGKWEQQVTLLDSGSQATGLTLGAPPEFLSRFEDRNMVLAWQSDDGKLQSFELPRFGLPFSMKDGRAYCDAIIGYFVSPKQWVDALGDYPHFLALENAKGQRKVLLPAQSINRKADRTGCLNTQNFQLVQDLENLSQAYHEYSINKDTGLLIPSTDLARFHLAMVHLWKMNYTESMKTLRGHEASLRPFNEDEVKQLTEIATLGHKSEDNDPRAIAIYLYATYLLKKNANDFPVVNRKEAETPDSEKLTNRYLKVLDKVADVRLKPSEEIFLLTNSATVITQTQLYRLRQLAAETGLDQTFAFPDVPPSLPLQQKALPISIPDLKMVRDGEMALESIQKRVLIRHMKNEQKFTSSVLTPPFADHFDTFYNMARGDLSADEFKAAYTEVTGITLPQQFDAKLELHKLFEIAAEYTQRQDANDSKVALAILRAVLQRPDSFRPLSGVSSNYGKGYYYLKTYKDDFLKPTLDYFEAMTSSLENPPRVIFKEKLTLPITQKVELPFEQCVTPYHATVLNSPIINDLSPYLEAIVLPLNNLNKAYEELKDLFDISTDDRIANRQFKNIRDDLSTYRDRTVIETPPTFVRMRDAAAFSMLRGDLETKLAQGKLDLKEKAVNLLQQANKSPSTTLGQARRQLEQFGHAEAPLDIDQLVNLFLLGDMDRFHLANPALTPDDILALDYQIMDYLVQATHLQHLQRIVDQMDSIQKERTAGTFEGDLSPMLESFLTAASATRAYDVKEHPQYLVFEYYMDILLRSEQVENLDLLAIKDGRIVNPKQIGVVLEMIMGAGKTDVLLPLIGQLNADGDALSIGLLPEALLPSMVQRLTERMGTAFGQSVEVLNYSREQRLSTRDLTLLRMRLEQVRMDRRMLFMTSSTVESLYLTFVETWYAYAQASPEKSGDLAIQLDVLRDIFRLFGEKGRAMIDESDIILNVLKEYHFTLGPPTLLPINNREMTCFLYELLLDPAIVPDMRFDFGAADATAPTFTPQQFREKIAPRLIEELLNRNLGVSEPEVTLFFRDLSADERALLHDYLSNTKNTAAINYVDSQESPLIKDLLGLAKEQVNELIPLTANKLMDENYGQIPGSIIPIAIPFHGANNPMVRSRYGEYETLNYTIQLILKRGISKDLVKLEIEELQQEALQLSNSGKPFIGSETHKKFLLLSGGDPQIRLFGSNDLGDKLTANVNNNIRLKLYFSKKYALQQIVSHPMTLSADPQIFNFLFALASGFSGYQWAEDTVPDKLQVLKSDVTTGKTLALLWTNSQNKVHVLPRVDAANLASGLIGNNPTLHHIHAIIDTAAIGRGVPNEVHARELLALPSYTQRKPPIDGVVFYDDQDQLVILERGESDIKPHSRSTLSIEQRCTFYDQKHTTGSDIKQPLGATALVTIGKQTILRDVLQSVWRMRGLEHGQTVEFAVDEEVNEIISTTLEQITGRKISEPLELRHILLFVTYNQAMKQGDNNFRSIKKKIKAELQATIFLAVLNKDVRVEALKGIFDDVKSLFVTENTTSTWEMFGMPQEEQDAAIVLDDLVNSAIESKAFKALEDNPTLAAVTDAPKVQQQIEILAEKALPALPQKLPSVDRRYGVEAETETEQKKQKETHKESETEMDKETTVYDNIEFDFRMYGLPKSSNIHSWNYFSEIEFEIGDHNSWDQPERPFVSLKQAMDNDSSFKEFESVFDPNILASLHLIRQYDQSKQYISEYGLFNYFQKATSDILVVQEKATGRLKFILNDPNDSDYIRALLESDTQEEGETRLCLYKPGYGSDRQGKERLDITALQKDPDFLRLLVQAKFFNGEVEYSDAELPHLEAWIKTHSIEKMKRLFDHIAAWKLTSRNALSASPLGKVFRQGASICVPPPPT